MQVFETMEISTEFGGAVGRFKAEAELLSVFV